MRMKRSELVGIIKEELSAHIRSLFEAPKAGVVDAQDDKKSKENKDKKDKKADPKKQEKPTPGGPDKAQQKPKDEPEEEPEKDVGADPADQDLEAQPDDTGDDEKAKEAETGPEDTKKVSDELVGKTIQSITANPKSKLMPGAMEIVIQFDQIPEPLKILVSKSGTVKYFFRGLHNEI
jgi:hypothetical protein